MIVIFYIPRPKAQKFVKVIKSWREWDITYDHNMIEEKTDEGEGNDESNTDGLVTELKNKGVYFIVDLCETLDEDLTLDALIDLSKQDLIELVNDINDDQDIHANVSVVKKNKFAKIVSGFRLQ